MVDGTVNLWQPSPCLYHEQIPHDDSVVVSRPPPPKLLTSITNKYKGAAVSAMKFNPHPDSINLLATGGSSGQVWMMDITSSSSQRQLPQPTNAVNVYSPNGDDNNGCNLGGEVTSVAWNTQVSHILASSSANGTVTVWDLRQKKPWCEIRVENNCPVSDIAWNPTQGLHIMTSSKLGAAGAMKLWDLRASTSMPLTTLDTNGHVGGVLSMDWCPFDDTLFVSCGNDNRTLLWDLYTLQPIAEIPNNDDQTTTTNHHQQQQQQQHRQQQQGPNDFYASSGGLASSQQKRFDVAWSPIRRGVISTCSFDRKVQAHSVLGLATASGRPPKWMSPASGVSCGFGGAVVSINNNNSQQQQQQQRMVLIDTFVEYPELAMASEKFEMEFSPPPSTPGETTADCCITYCNTMATRATDPYEQQVWSFMQIMFETNAREELLSYLGFDPEKIHQAAMEFSEEEKVAGGCGGGGGGGGESNGPSNNGGKVASVMSKVAAEVAIKDALLVGNFEAAVECCFRSGNLADALVLSSCGGAELWQKTQSEYFTRESERRPYLSLVSAVINDQLNELVVASDPANWRETLAVLSTYAKSDEFPTLCAVLGDRLEDGGDFANASLCYMCSLKLGDAIRYWKFTLQSAKMADDGTNTTDLLSLHDFIEKVTVFTQAIDSSQVVLDDDAANIFTDYAKALTNQGLCVSAAKYLKGFNTQECNELRDRIYCGRMGRFCSDLQASPPDFPFDFVNVGIANDLYGITVKQGGGGKEQENIFAVNSTDANYTQQQSQEGHQSQHHVKHHSPQFEPTPDPSADPSLPPGWVALQDPSSGQTYYANQGTGESSWDPPQMMIPTAAVPSPLLQPVTNSSYDAQTVVQPVVKNVSFNTTNGSTSTSQKVASKYGDGFVTSASNPVLAEQYGNVGTSNPYTNANRPGTAAAAVGNTPKKAPISGTWDPDSLPELSLEQKELQDGLMSIVDRLIISAVGSMETKQATESQKAVAVFIKTFARGGMDDDIVNKVRLMMYNLQNRDYASASSIVTGLVSNEWKDHKDWLKGMKFLVQMVTKKQL